MIEIGGVEAGCAVADDRRTDIVVELAALVGDLHNRSPGTGGLFELVDSARRNVPGSDHAGITLAHRRQGISSVAATHRYAKLLDEIQQRHQDGPCLTAAWEHHTVRIDDLATESRWPLYQREALAQTPVRSVMSFEIVANRDAMAALNFYAERPRAFTHESTDLGAIYASHVALAWTMLRRDEQFRSALASRDLIGQAKGIIMERFRVDAVRAFELLKQLSQDQNVKLVDVAQRLIDADHPRGENGKGADSAGT